ncbi:hypothetical protein E1263_05420 [Kribbella antibiotica]|uniref:Uncharacterized protein n=1 Tax=Kribbella antibiotica TaxID=190195 RepID=A0A4R4ZXZ1_9ACTN|nr:hypothetical protein [Kribbella antibiotica]TDD62052.1 hypothetical protein E1263_05420 [Kribbella antibiotica]
MSATEELLPRLPDIHEIRPRGPEDDAVFADIKAVLERHGALNRFGVTLLHQHFEIAQDESLVEHIDVENRTLVIRPMRDEEYATVVETSWRLDAPSGMASCETKCVKEKDIDGNEYHNKPHYTVK